MEEKRRIVRRSSDERIAELDKKIAYHQRSIANLEKKKKSIVNGVKKPAFSSLVAELTESGLTPDEIRSACEQLTQSTKKTRTTKKEKQEVV